MMSGRKMISVPLKENERMDYLPVRRLKIIQSEDVFVFSLDAILLAQFTYLPLQKGKIMDLCTGNGAIPLMLSMRTKARIDGVDIQHRLVDMAKRSVRFNQLADQIDIRQLDVRDVPAVYGYGSYDVVTCNPPYLPGYAGQYNDNPHLALARHELKGTLEDFVRVAGDIVRPRGKIAFVHRPARMLELLTLMRRYRLEPKRLRFVYPKPGREANMMLVEGMKDGSADLRLLPPLFVYREDDCYTQEMEQILGDESRWWMGRE